MATTYETQIDYQASQDICNTFPAYLYPTYNQWYGVGHVPFLSIPAHTTGFDDGAFLSFETPTSINQKVSTLLSTEGLGGVILWNINSGYIDSGPNAGQDPLLTDVKNAVNAYCPGALQ
jgi:GH18 family chitinase